MHTARSPKSVPVRMDPPDVVWEVGGEAWVTGHLPATAASLSWCLFSQRSISTPPAPPPTTAQSIPVTLEPTAWVSRMSSGGRGKGWHVDALTGSPSTDEV